MADADVRHTAVQQPSWSCFHFSETQTGFSGILLRVFFVIFFASSLWARPDLEPTDLCDQQNNAESAFDQGYMWGAKNLLGETFSVDLCGDKFLEDLSHGCQEQRVRLYIRTWNSLFLQQPSALRTIEMLQPGQTGRHTGPHTSR